MNIVQALEEFIRNKNYPNGFNYENCPIFYCNYSLFNKLLKQFWVNDFGVILNRILDDKNRPIYFIENYELRWDNSLEDNYIELRGNGNVYYKYVITANEIKQINCQNIEADNNNEVIIVDD
jgi:hypothetical protein